MNFNKKIISFFLVAVILAMASCEKFEEFNENPNEPTEVSPDVLLPSAVRSSVETMVNASFLIGNTSAQLTAKTLRTEVDAYDWDAFPTVWEGLYKSLTDVYSFEDLAIEQENEVMEGAAVVLRSWIFSVLTNAYGNIPYFEAIDGSNNNFTPAYDDQADIYADLMNELDRANTLLASGNGSINGDILLGGDVEMWRKFCNSLRLRLLMLANQQLGDAGSQFSSIVASEPILSAMDENVTLTYTGSFPNIYPLVDDKTGDFDAVAISQTSLDVMAATGDPRLMRYARPNNESFDENAVFLGATNGPGDECNKDGASRLGVQYYNYPNLKTAASLGLPMAEGIIMTHAEVEFLLAEAAAKGWIDDDIEMHYKNGIASSMTYHMVDTAPFGWKDFEDFYDNSGVAYDEVTDIWQQKWLALYFHGLQPYFELRRWYHESGMSFDGIPFMEASCNNRNNDQLPLRFQFPGQEQSLNLANYQAAIDAMGGSDSQNVRMWLVE